MVDDGNKDGGGSDAGGPPERQSLTEARFRLSRMKIQNDLKAVLQRAVEISSQALNVARVGVWFYQEEDFVCEALFDCANPGTNEALPTVKIAALPAYIHALNSERFLALHDARTDPRSIETLEYLKIHGISSMLDAAIFRNGEVAGVVCHEHRGEPRLWTPAERQFAATVADLVTTFVETQNRLDAQEAQHVLELQLRKARRLEAVGRFAAGVSHDLGNLLTAVNTGVALLKKNATPKTQEAIELITESTRQCMDLARDLTSLKISEPTRPVVESVVKIADHLKALLAPQLGDNVTVQWDIDPEVRVWADVTQLEQVLFNLVLNARDAMPSGGTVVVRARPSTQDGCVTFEVIDTGVGIAPENLERIFDPFFTTRTEGTGMGLSIVEQLTSLHGGDVRVTSVVDEGTTFTVNWPMRRRC
jgi:two-component system, cell cycle sensor histidine kinase and response regulator CckA